MLTGFQLIGSRVVKYKFCGEILMKRVFYCVVTNRVEVQGKESITYGVEIVETDAGGKVKARGLVKDIFAAKSKAVTLVTKLRKHCVTLLTMKEVVAEYLEGCN